MIQYNEKDMLEIRDIGRQDGVLQGMYISSLVFLVSVVLVVLVIMW